jgi:hypothetical protein
VMEAGHSRLGGGGRAASIGPKATGLGVGVQAEAVEAKLLMWRLRQWRAGGWCSS